MTGLIMYVATAFPYKLAFLDFRIGSNSGEADEWFIIQLMVDIFFYVDLVVNFLLSYRNEEDWEVCDIRLTALRYLKGMFFLDLIACMPSAVFQALMDAALSNQASGNASPSRAINLTKLQRLTRLARLLRLRQVAKLLELEWVQAIIRFRGFRLCGLTAGVMWLVHLLGAGWYIVAALGDNATTQSWVALRSLPDGSSLVEHSPAEQWAHSMYFVLTVFTTVGFGDMSARTSGEIVYVSMLMLVGGVVNGTVLTYVMAILQESDRKDLAVNNIINTLKDFADHTQLTSSTTHQMLRLARQRRAGAELDSDSVKKIFGGLVLPRHIVAELPPRLWKGKLLRNNIFRLVKDLRQVSDFPPRMTLFIASMLKVLQSDQDELMYTIGDMPINVFIVVVGVYSFVAVPAGGTSDVLAPYQLIGSRSYFGDAEMLLGLETREATVRCESATATSLLLAKNDLLKVVNDFPAFASALGILAARREASRKRRLQNHTKVRTIEQLSYDTITRFARVLHEKKPSHMVLPVNS